MYVNISKQNTSQVSSSTRERTMSLACALLGSGGSVGVWSSDPGRAKIPRLGVWFWSSITAHWTWYVPHSSSSKERISKSRYMFSSSTQYGSYNACHMSRHSIIRLSTQHPLLQQLALIKDITFNLWIAAAKHRHMSYDIMTNLFSGEAVGQLRSERFSFKRNVCVWCNWFYSVSGYCFLIMKFPVVPTDAKKWGYNITFLLASLVGSPRNHRR